MTSPKRPIERLNDGLLKASIWKNPTDKGHFYTATISNAYRDDSGEYHDTNSYNDNELLRVARLAERAYQRISELRQADKAAQAA